MKHLPLTPAERQRLDQMLDASPDAVHLLVGWLLASARTHPAIAAEVRAFMSNRDNSPHKPEAPTP